jgi:hypothetical protein
MLTRNSWSSCLSLPSARITGMPHHPVLFIYFDTTDNVLFMVLDAGSLWDHDRSWECFLLGFQKVAFPFALTWKRKRREREKECSLGHLCDLCEGSLTYKNLHIIIVYNLVSLTHVYALFNITTTKALNIPITSKSLCPFGFFPLFLFICLFVYLKVITLDMRSILLTTQAFHTHLPPGVFLQAWLSARIA